MRWLPSTLFGRLAGVLILGLLAAQLAAGWVLLRDRGSALFEEGGRHTVQRIASAVQVLESIDPAQRKVFLRAVNTRTLRVTLSHAPKRAATRDGWRAKRLNRMLHRRLGDRPIWIHITQNASLNAPQRPGMPAPGMPPAWFGPEGAPWGGLNQPPNWATGRPPNAQPRHPMDWRDAQQPLRGTQVEIRTRLADGSWIKFTQLTPASTTALPSRALWGIALLVAAVIALALFAVRRVTRPLAMLGRAAESLGRDIHSNPLPEDGPQEVRHAARAFNTMQQRIARYVKDREQMLAAVSHDLKTPITRLRLRAEMLDDDGLRDKINADLADMETMVNGTLDFMRGAGEREPIQPIDIIALLESQQADAQEAGEQVTLNGNVSTPYPARPLALKRALDNLIGNAIRYGGSAEVQLEDHADRLIIRVADPGPGIPEARLEQVFEPFVRLETSRNPQTGGTGLGLAIARSIARGHGGELSLKNRPGGGLIATLILPR